MWLRRPWNLGHQIVRAEIQGKGRKTTFIGNQKRWEWEEGWNGIEFGKQYAGLEWVSQGVLVIKTHLLMQETWKTRVWYLCFPGSSDGKESACNAGDLGSVPGLGRSLVEGNGNPLQNSCLENSLDRGAWWATFHGLTKSQMTGCTCMHCSYIHVLYIT